MRSVNPVSVFAVLFAAIVLIGASSAAAQDVCVRPFAPNMPDANAARSMTAVQIDQYRVARDEYFVAMDSYLDCTNRQIETRMKAMFASNAPLDGGLQALGAAHRSASEERSAVYERFATACMAWEDMTQAPLPGRCVTVRSETRPTPRR